MVKGTPRSLRGNYAAANPHLRESSVHEAGSIVLRCRIFAFLEQVDGEYPIAAEMWQPVPNAHDPWFN